MWLDESHQQSWKAVTLTFPSLPRSFFVQGLDINHTFFPCQLSPFPWARWNPHSYLQSTHKTFPAHSPTCIPRFWQTAHPQSENISQPPWAPGTARRFNRQFWCRDCCWCVLFANAAKAKRRCTWQSKRNAAWAYGRFLCERWDTPRFPLQRQASLLPISLPPRPPSCARPKGSSNKLILFITDASCAKKTPLPLAPSQWQRSSN